MSASSNFAFQKGRRSNETGASLLGLTGCKPGNGEGCLKMGRHTTPRRRSTFVPQTNGGPVNRTNGPVMPSAGMTEEEAARKFQALVMPFSKGDLATAACRTKEAAKHWKDGTRAPNSSSLINIGRRIPRVREWVLAEMDVQLPHSEANNADAEEIASLQLAANFPGQLGAIAKLLLKQKLGGN